MVLEGRQRQSETACATKAEEMKRALLLLATVGVLAIAINFDSRTSDIYQTMIEQQAQAAQTVAVEAPQAFPRDVGSKGGICINNRMRAPYTNIIVSREEVAFHAAKYWSGNDLEIALALTLKEGQRDLNCFGDDVAPYYGAKTADGRTWGESIGLYQYRTIVEATGKGGCEDLTWQQGNIERQTKCAYEDKFVKRGWQPWSMFTNGKYREALGK
jgi:hypothetical protein